MTPAVGFVTFLLVTLAFLGGAVVTGLKANRKVHLPCVALAVLSLVVTIYYAEQLGDLYDLKAAGFMTPLHLALAKITTLAYLAPVITGVRTLRNPASRKFHGRVAFFVLFMTVLTAITGTSMLLMSNPL
jgi:hypothetical protein